MIATQPPWTDPERALWAPPRAVTVSEWADEHRVISERFGNPEPGKWSTARTPYLREIQDAYADPELDEVGHMKPAQFGGSEALRNFLGFAIDQDPGPTMMCFATQDAAERQFQKRIIPLIEDTPKLKAHLVKYDKTLIECDTMPIQAAWAGSPQVMASDPMRNVIPDEVDKYGQFSGRESDPLALLLARLETFGHRSKFLPTSTPTTPQGNIYRFWESCRDRRRFHVKCSACGAIQALDFLARMRWTEERGEPVEQTIARLEAGDGQVWLECKGCKRPMLEGERDSLLASGLWVAEGFAPGQYPKTRRRCYASSGLMATIGRTWRKLVIKWLRVKDDVAKRMEFVNQQLGEPFFSEINEVKGDALHEKARRGHKRTIVPPWAGILIASADTQKDGFPWIIRSWGVLRRSPTVIERSRLVDLGFARTLEDLRRATLGAEYPIADANAVTTGEVMRPALLLVDSAGGRDENMDASRTEEVYRFAKSDPRIVPVKGWGSWTGGPADAKLVMPRNHTYKIRGTTASLTVPLHVLHTQALKDILARLVALEAAAGGAPEEWELCGDLPEDYFRQLQAEHKVFIRKGTGGMELWQKKSHGTANHFLDCEVYNLAGAVIARVDTIPEEATLVREREQVRFQRERVVQPHAHTGLTTPDGRPFLITRRT